MFDCRLKVFAGGRRIRERFPGGLAAAGAVPGGAGSLPGERARVWSGARRLPARQPTRVFQLFTSCRAGAAQPREEGSGETDGAPFFPRTLPPLMAANPTPTNNGTLLAQCHDLWRALVELEAEVGVKQNTAASLLADLEAARAAQRHAALVKKERSELRRAFRQTDREGERLIGSCRLRLAALFGGRFNTQWGAAGFTGRSTRVPESFAGRQSVLSRLALYFARKPEHENAGMNATAALCHAMHAALGGARGALNTNRGSLTLAVREKGAAMRQLRQRMRGLLRELWTLLPVDDPRWLSFGLNPPAAPTPASPVAEVRAERLPDGRVLASWPRARHARRYRVQTRAGGGAEWRNARTLRGRETLLADLDPALPHELRVIAANRAGEAPPSPVTRVEVL